MPRRECRNGGKLKEGKTMASYAENDCMLEAEKRAKANGWDHSQTMECFYTLCDLWGVNGSSRKPRQKRSGYAAEQRIARMTAQLERTNAALERARAAEAKAKERLEKARAKHEALIKRLEETDGSRQKRDQRGRERWHLILTLGAMRGVKRKLA